MPPADVPALSSLFCVLTPKNFAIVVVVAVVQ